MEPGLQYSGCNGSCSCRIRIRVLSRSQGVYEFRYYQTVGKKSADQPLAPLFTDVVIPANIGNDALQHLNNLKISVTAHAIQKDGFANADLAWAAFNAEMNPVPTESPEVTTTTAPVPGE